MEEEYYRLEEKGIRFITHLDPDYPSVFFPCMTFRLPCM